MAQNLLKAVDNPAAFAEIDQIFFPQRFDPDLISYRIFPENHVAAESFVIGFIPYGK